jgi:hypothetical protein
MSNIIPVEISVWQNIIDQYSSNFAGKKLSKNELDDLEFTLENDLSRIASKKNIYYEIVSSNLMYFEANSSLGARLGYFPPPWEGSPAWGVSIPISNFGAIKLSYFKGNYIKTPVVTEKSMYYKIDWENEPELEESGLISSPILMNLETPFSYQNQSSSPAIILNLRCTPSLLAV